MAATPPPRLPPGNQMDKTHQETKKRVKGKEKGKKESPIFLPKILPRPRGRRPSISRSSRGIRSYGSFCFFVFFVQPYSHLAYLDYGGTILSRSPCPEGRARWQHPEELRVWGRNRRTLAQAEGVGARALLLLGASRSTGAARQTGNRCEYINKKKSLVRPE